jgi:DNA-binding transcriptional MerR regulator
VTDSPGADEGVFGISVAAGMVGMDPQSLRLYERRGLLTPARTEGGTRLYSGNDIERLRRIAELFADGLNIAGIEMVLGLESANELLRADNAKAAASAPKRRRRDK